MSESKSMIRAFAVAAACVAVLGSADPVPATEDRPATAREWYERARELTRTKQRQQAADAFDRSVALDPERALVWANRGTNLLNMGRYEAARPRELYHLDFYHFHVHKQKQCVLFIEDDHSRFIVGWTMVSVEAAEPVIGCFEQCVQRYGRPEAVMSDRGSAFHSWRGLSRFEALLEDYEVNFHLAKEAAVNGKVEALNASFDKECVQAQEFMDLSDAARVIGRWVEHYNHHRTHHGLGGLLVPADRFYGIAEQTLRRIEQGLGASSPELASPDGRALELFRVLSRGGKPELWLMGQKILG